ncbi:YitT family protein [Pseudoflavonifractor sp. SW1122]|uniref:YczE/YyaS/YitT family protein n=1 Tax=Pseudoflavonifractor sp. SW1122 TaxID=2530044 RepID=UPI00143AB628|nr:DUF6198 family protein [Pseudoflavonifractor sp. SW1122]NJE73733.1 YitT family protein [Pseudoflavonifractor sp. SW1122]
MRQSNRTPLTHPLRRILFLCLGLMIMAFGVAFSIKAGLGTSPISSVPYVTSEISGLSVGATTIIMNFLFVLIQIAILRRNYDWFQILQFPAAILFGFTIDVAEWVIAPLPCSGYLMAWGYCALGIALIAFGVSVEVMAHLVTTAGEGIVLAICQVAPVKFGNMKMCFDVTLVCIAIVLSLVFLGHLSGVREGTIAAAILVGQITKQTNKLTKKVELSVLS